MTDVQTIYGKAFDLITRALKVQATVRDVQVHVGPFMLTPPPDEPDPEGWLLNCTEADLLARAREIIENTMTGLSECDVDAYPKGHPLDGKEFIHVCPDLNMVGYTIHDVNVDVVDGPLDISPEETPDA